ncbi:bacterioferritin [Thalassospira marina]|uniref:Bacterioferritin n=1 Tax=Thalassospira marina TaxID=2048283 RepID=A0A2N3KG95_9PROT|nr:bacterioferritin [Thalassospira marina]AUG53083.1 bacterioferritin [Thalassospira marina]PKR49544.1 bacterioferritin [Thalassospira marina]
MKGDRQIIGYLNRILTNQLTAINQYFLHARMLKNWGVVEMGEYEYKLSIKEMKRADDLIERILFLDGLPNLQNLNKLLIGENVSEIVDCDMKYELAALPLLREAISACEKSEDFVTRDLLVSFLEDQEEHVDWLETEQWQLDNVGIQNYIQSRSGDGD